MSDRNPALPLFVDDYEAATTHLSLEEDGAYTRLLRLSWRTPGCSIPTDDEWIRRRMRVDELTYQRVVLPVLCEFFEKRKRRWVQKRLLSESVFVNERKRAMSDAGKRGASARWRENNQKGDGKAKATAKRPQSDRNGTQPNPSYPPLSPRSGNAGSSRGGPPDKAAVLRDLVAKVRNPHLPNPPPDVVRSLLADGLITEDEAHAAKGI